MKIEVLGKDCFTSSKLISELHQLLAPSFEKPAVVLQRAIEKSSRLYLGKDSTERIVSFFFSDLGSHLMVMGNALPSLHLGLSGARQELKTLGATLPLYNLCLADAAQWEANTGKKLWVWGTTSRTAVLRIAYKYLTSISPSVNGTFSAEAKALAQSLREYLKVPMIPSEHPFLLRRAFQGFGYTEEETRHVQQAILNDSFVLAHNLNIRDCDFILFVGQIGEKLPEFHKRTQVKVVYGQEMKDEMIERTLCLDPRLQ